MLCPHCQHHYHAEQQYFDVHFAQVPRVPKLGNDGNALAFYGYTKVCPRCSGAIIDLKYGQKNGAAVVSAQVYPRGGSFPPAPSEVPEAIRKDYSEANEVLPISPKASAALARRCLQAVLMSHGYKQRDLVKQVQAALDEEDARKALPSQLRENIDAIRNFGNFSAHPITEATTLQIVEVDEGEAEWCLQLLLDLFDHYYVAPSRAAERRATLSQKLAAAGKPPMKGSS